VPAHHAAAPRVTNAPFVEFDDLSIEFASSDGPVLALDHASLHFEEGAFV